MQWIENVADSLAVYGRIRGEVSEIHAPPTSTVKRDGRAKDFSFEFAAAPRRLTLSR